MKTIWEQDNGLLPDLHLSKAGIGWPPAPRQLRKKTAKAASLVASLPRSIASGGRDGVHRHPRVPLHHAAGGHPAVAEGGRDEEGRAAAAGDRHPELTGVS